MNISFISKLGLCSGCGACIAFCPNSALVLEKSLELNKPKLLEYRCSDCGKCLKICSGFYNFNIIMKSKPIVLPVDKLKAPAGFIGHSNNSSLRKAASSGGYITSLLLTLMAQKKIDGVITIKNDLECPLENNGGIIKDINSLSKTTGSKYFPASACIGLKGLDKLDGCFAFVGKPCEITAARLLIENHPEKYRNRLLLISLFCAHTPSRKKVLDLLKKQGIIIDQIEEIRYRGNGWPGYFQVIGKNQTKLIEKPYREIWDNCLSRDIPTPCRLCKDPFGKLSDISVGDAWGFEDSTGFGLSSIIIRTELGKEYHSYVRTLEAISCDSVRLKDIIIGQRSISKKLKNGKIAKEVLKSIDHNGIWKLPLLILEDDLTLEEKIQIILLCFKIRYNFDIYNQLHQLMRFFSKVK